MVPGLYVQSQSRLSDSEADSGKQTAEKRPSIKLREKAEFKSLCFSARELLVHPLRAV